MTKNSVDFSPATQRRLRELVRRLNDAQTAANEFLLYVADEYGVPTDWILRADYSGFDAPQTGAATHGVRAGEER